MTRGMNDCNVPTTVSFMLSLQNVKGNVWMFPFLFQFLFFSSAAMYHILCIASLSGFVYFRYNFQLTQLIH